MYCKLLQLSNIVATTELFRRKDPKNNVVHNPLQLYKIKKRFFKWSENSFLVVSVSRFQKIHAIVHYITDIIILQLNIQDLSICRLCCCSSWHNRRGAIKDKRSSNICFFSSYNTFYFYVYCIGSFGQVKKTVCLI